jgi:YVTN family beta-propeller protein
LVISRDGAYAYTTDMGSNTISVISTAKRAVVATIPVGQAPSSIALVEP